MRVYGPRARTRSSPSLGCCSIQPAGQFEGAGGTPRCLLLDKRWHRAGGLAQLRFANEQRHVGLCGVFGAGVWRKDLRRLALLHQAPLMPWALLPNEYVRWVANDESSTYLEVTRQGLEARYLVTFAPDGRIVADGSLVSPYEFDVSGVRYLHR